MFGREKVGEEDVPCPKCGTKMTFFLQHSHGNYPILDYVCPKCDLGGEKLDVDWEAMKKGDVSQG